MSTLRAKTGSKATIGGKFVGKDGYTLEFDNAESLSAWYATLRWNLHFHYWRVAARNLYDLPKYLWRTLWRRI